MINIKIDQHIEFINGADIDTLREAMKKIVNNTDWLIFQINLSWDFPEGKVPQAYGIIVFIKFKP